jgi:hypothetical protein
MPDASARPWEGLKTYGHRVVRYSSADAGEVLAYCALLRYMAETDTDGEAYHMADCGDAGSAYSVLIGSLIVGLAPLVQK